METNQFVYFGNEQKQVSKSLKHVTSYAFQGLTMVLYNGFEKVFAFQKLSCTVVVCGVGMRLERLGIYSRCPLPNMFLVP